MTYYAVNRRVQNPSIVLNRQDKAKRVALSFLASINERRRIRSR